MGGVAFDDARPLRVVFVGLGSIGTRHLRNLADRAPIDVTACRSSARALTPAVAELVNHESADLDAALQSKPDAVFITNPTSKHLASAMAAAKSGAHLFIEKPVSDSLEGVAELATEVAAGRLLTLVGYNTRFRPTLRRVKRWLDDDRIGRPLSVRVQMGEWLPLWHPGEDYRRGVSARRDLGGGALLDLSHEIDSVRWLLGPVRRVACFSARASSLEIETEDVAEILLEFKNGAIGNVHVDYLQQPASRTYHLHGERGTIVWDALKAVARCFEARTGEWTEYREPPGERDRSFGLEMDHWLDCLRKGRATSIGLEDGCAVLEIVLAAKESARVGRAVDVRGGR